MIKNNNYIVPLDLAPISNCCIIFFSDETMLSTRMKETPHQMVQCQSFLNRALEDPPPRCLILKNQIIMVTIPQPGLRPESLKTLSAPSDHSEHP